MNVEWRKAITSFLKTVEDQIAEFENDANISYDIRLPTMLKTIEKITPQIQKWADVIAKLKKYHKIIELEFEQWDSEEFIKLKKEMILEQDDRKAASKKVYPLTDTEVKIRRKANRGRMLSLKAIARVESVIQYLETKHYWTSINCIELLKVLKGFSVSYEKNIKV